MERKISRNMADRIREETSKWKDKQGLINTNTYIHMQRQNKYMNMQMEQKKLISINMQSKAKTYMLVIHGQNNHYTKQDMITLQSL